MINRTLDLEKDDNEARVLKEVIYTPESALRRPSILVRQMLDDLRNSRELAWRLFSRDIRAQYRQSLLGYVWLLLPPIASTVLFVFLRSQRILNVEQTEVPYPIYVLTGIVLWQVFSTSLNAPLGTIAGAAPMLSKLNFPREALLWCAVYHTIFGLSLRCLLLVGAFCWFQHDVTPMILLAPMGVMALMAFGFTVGLLLVPLGILYQDVGKALGMGMSVWFLVTPVIYPPPTNWPASILCRWNPLSSLLVTTREMLTVGELSMFPAFLLISLITTLLLFLGWVIYRITMPHLVARMTA